MRIIIIVKESIMLDFMMSQTGVWVTVTIIFMIVVMSWFVYKMVKLSAPKK